MLDDACCALILSSFFVYFHSFFQGKMLAGSAHQRCDRVADLDEWAINISITNRSTKKNKSHQFQCESMSKANKGEQVLLTIAEERTRRRRLRCTIWSRICLQCWVTGCRDRTSTRCMPLTASLTRTTHGSSFSASDPVYVHRANKVTVLRRVSRDLIFDRNVGR